MLTKFCYFVACSVDLKYLKEPKIKRTAWCRSTVENSKQTDGYVWYLSTSIKPITLIEHHMAHKTPSEEHSKCVYMKSVIAANRI